MKVETEIPRKEEKEDLATVTRELRMFFEEISEVVYSVDMIGYKIIQMSAACEKVYGYTPAEFLSDRELWQRVIHPADKHISEQQVGDLYKGRQVLNQYRIIHKDGNIRWIENKILPVIDSNGTLVRIHGVTNDITERKKAEQVLELSNKRLEEAEELGKSGHWHWDVSNDKVTWSAGNYRLYGIQPDEFNGTYEGVLETVYPDDRDKMQQALERLYKEDKLENFEYRIVRPDGSIAHLKVTGKATRNAEGAIVSMFGTTLDTTSLKQAEEMIQRSEAELEIKNKELQLKNKELEQFAYITSHDLQEPLRTISSFAELLQQHYQTQVDEKAEKYFTFIHQSSERMRILIKDLLDYSRIGKKAHLERVDCNKILSEVLDDLGKAIHESGAEVISNTLPVICGYPTEIKQVFQNLIMNAIKFRGKSTVPKIEIGVRKNGAAWYFTVKDNGIGIDEQHKERIFIIFQRLHTRTEYEGSGIGLAHCKKIVELHGGKIWMDSTPGNGTTFHFTIPQTNLQ